MKTPWGENDWNRALVYGLGASGLAAAAFLRSRGVHVIGVDRRPGEALDLGALAGDPGLELLLGADPESLPRAVDGVVLSPGVPPERPLLLDARRQGIPVISEVELAFPYLNGPAVGVTGSNGKSTTTALAGAALQASGLAAEVCGNIGVPVTSRVEGAPGRVFVVELSSFQLESVDTFRPRAAALLNLTADHLDRHADLEAYRAAKEAIFARQEPDDVAVLNADDPYVAAIGARARRRFFSRLHPVEDGCYLDGERVVEMRPGASPVELFRPEELRVPGQHNLENAMAAALLALAMGADSAAVRTGLASFRGLPHRLERIASREGVLWFNDSKGTNIDATLRSLEGFEEGSVHLILGGRHKGGDPALLADAVRAKTRRVYLIGEAAEEFERALAPVATCEQCGDLERAVVAAGLRAEPGEVVLMSPACASFDQYDNFAQRGEHFNCLVRALAEGDDG
jgi:UDP-N-acetylmuramoylalanine--D-glutamate ligase